MNLTQQTNQQNVWLFKLAIGWVGLKISQLEPCATLIRDSYQCDLPQTNQQIPLRHKTLNSIFITSSMKCKSQCHT